VGGVVVQGTGLRFLPWTLTRLLIAPAAGALADKVGPRPLMALGLAALGVGRSRKAPSAAQQQAPALASAQR
jgi:MFS family permease